MTQQTSDSTNSTKSVVNIYCDGACSGNPGPGGWAAILKKPGTPKEKIVSGRSSEKTTTNNRMELQAAIEGLKALLKPCKVMLFSDSKYLVDTMTKNWKRNANEDLWEQLDKLAKTHEVTWMWLARNSTPELEKCDELARQQSKL